MIVVRPQAPYLIAGIFPSRIAFLNSAIFCHASLGVPLACSNPAPAISGLAGSPSFPAAPSDSSCQHTLCTYGLEAAIASACAAHSACAPSLHGLRQCPGSYGSSGAAPAPRAALEQLKGY